MPEWMGPPEHVVPGVAALELLLVNTGLHAVWIGEAEVYPSGLVLTVHLHGRKPAPPGLESGPGTWRFGVQFSDGRKAAVYGVGSARPAGGVSATTASSHGSGVPPVDPVLRARGGGGSRSVWRQEYWLWPLPPPGDLLIAWEWPNADTALTTTTIRADPVLDAASRAHELWPVEDLPEWPGRPPGPPPSAATS